ncbi:class I SAM-dependent methyltransferase [Streptosporangium fragile]|uniref:Class I SAM-dependent methyltransferase n=1 Tax=Streptosporangium fragile TaxID=46186 RepID=A0ABN3VRB4_9ACTN
MNAEKIDVTGLNDDGITWTLLATLYLRAWESRAERPILGDHHAAEALDRIDYDFATLERRLRPRSNQFLVALRARRLDDWSAAFLARHPDATVLQLGCGLDSRMLRLDPPAPARWFDLDVPKVIDLRRRLYPERDRYRMIGASVTDPDWLRQVPADRPTLIIAEGLLPYLPGGDVRRLLQRLTDHFPSGELLFDGMAPWVTRMIKVFHWGVRDGREIERWNPRLRCVAQVSFGAGYERIPVRRYRLVYRLGNGIPTWRRMSQLFRFAF